MTHSRFAAVVVAFAFVFFLSIVGGTAEDVSFRLDGCTQMFAGADGWIRVTQMKCESDDPCYRAFCRNGTCVLEPDRCALSDLELRRFVSKIWNATDVLDRVTIAILTIVFIGVMTVFALEFAASTLIVRHDAVIHELHLSASRLLTAEATDSTVLTNPNSIITKSNTGAYGVHESDVECISNSSAIKSFALSNASGLRTKFPSAYMSTAFVSCVPLRQFLLAKTPAEVIACYKDARGYHSMGDVYVSKKNPEDAANVLKEEEK